MIIRERKNDFVMIEQDHHARISGELFQRWDDRFLKGREHYDSVAFAIENHDCGWKPADKQPIWNDKKKAPYDFTNYPLSLKTLVYRYGIDKVAEAHPYAGLLCSEHYVRFMLHDNSEDARGFVQSERNRQGKLIQSLRRFDSDLFEFHYGLLQLCDNLSLYLCLNEPGALKEREHPFFKSGIPLSSALDVFEKKKMDLCWINRSTVKAEEFPFTESFSITLKQRVLLKKKILEEGLVHCYQTAPEDEVKIHLTR